MFFESFAPEILERLATRDVEKAEKHVPLQVGDIPDVRFTIPPPEAGTIDAYTFDFLEHLLARARAQNIPMIDWPRTEQSFFLITVGVHHQIPMERLIDRTKCMSLMIIEPDLNALDWSMDFADWGALVAKVQDRGGTVDFFFADAAPQLSAILWRTMRSINPVCSDGTYLAAFGHPALAKALTEQFIDDLALSYTSLGFFYDESLMIWNTYQNLTTRNAHIFERQLQRRLDTPVFVVASGPSLDASIETIKAHADNAIVISCGSALRPLLVNGIVPDFQIETENTQVSPLTLQSARDFDISGVTLVASATIDPGVLDSFDNIVFFFRSPLSSYPLFAPSDQTTLFMPDPTVGNAGLTFALELGFTDIFMFGTDCGSRIRDRHHSQDTYHYTAEAGDIDIRYDMPVEGNFGGEVWTNYGLYAAISNYVELIKVLGADRSIRNCSDGAMIAGTVPLKPEDVSLPIDGADKKNTIRKIVEAMPSFLGADQDFTWMGQTFGETVRGYCNLVRERIEDIEDFADKGYQNRLMDLFQPRIGYFTMPPKGVNHCVNILMRGTFFSMLLFFERYLARVAYEKDVQRFGRIGIEALLASLASLERDAKLRFGGDNPVEPPPPDTVTRAPGTRLPEPPSPPRNGPCPCGSGKKFKHCHGKPT